MLERTNCRGLLLGASVLILATSNIYAQSSSAIPDKITGYGGYQFGMRLEDAKKIDARAKVTDCGYTDTAFCLERKDSFFGEAGEVSVLFSAKDKRVWKINISFKRLDGTDGACRNVSKTVVEALFRRFGKPTTAEPGKASWFARLGGVISFSSICIDEDKGIIVVSYTPSAAF
jgi:hypothetical protein